MFCFPEPFDNGLRLKDFIDSTDTVDKKYYLNDAMLEKLKLANTTTNGVTETDSAQRLRRLTPKECWRLMGFTDDLYDKAKQAGVTDTQLYKQAGNSIVTDVLYYIYQSVYKTMPYLFEDLTVLSLFSGIGAFETALDRFYADVTKSETCISGSKTAAGVIEMDETAEVAIVDATYANRAPRVYTVNAPTLRAGRAGFLVTPTSEKNLIKLGNIYPSGGQNGNVYSTDGVAPTISSGVTDTKGNGGVGSSNAPKILVNTHNIKQ